ncbi:hypothetical protein ACTWQL_08300 [Pseudalkalibacillus sp. R45]|uniref:hypothetical protein n=1 Tax=Pseudalkalibacillus sp. R45 TaxID=3457433 RepID=UPI003FCE5016
MAKFLIDHKHKKIHRSAYVGDKCDLPQIPLKERSGEKKAEKVELLKGKGYKHCPHCYDGPTFI